MYYETKTIKSNYKGLLKWFKLTDGEWDVLGSNPNKREKLT